MLVNLRALFGVVLDIILLRRGPEQLPASPTLLVAAVVLYVAGFSFFVLVLPLTLPAALIQSALGAAVMLLWFRIALAIAGKPERFLQTLTAIFAVNVMFLPILVPLLGAVLPYLEKADPSVPIPAALVIVTMIVGIWGLLVEVHIVRAAFECPWVGGFLLVVGEIFASVFVASLLFGGAHAGG
ncbi:MAG TPA: hypothetical protein VFP37_07705 [Steroidobacteraceae bacterium]|nr:hypothetical protein [Steroidobacteraceae bacterium]